MIFKKSTPEISNIDEPNKDPATDTEAVTLDKQKEKQQTDEILDTSPKNLRKYISAREKVGSKALDKCHKLLAKVGEVRKKEAEDRLQDPAFVEATAQVTQDGEKIYELAQNEQERMNAIKKTADESVGLLAKETAREERHSTEIEPETNLG